jgi:hypothetical protein
MGRNEQMRMELERAIFSIEVKKRKRTFFSIEKVEGRTRGRKGGFETDEKGFKEGRKKGRSW